MLNFDYIVIIVAVRSSFYASKPWATTSNSYFPIPRPPLSMQPHWPSYGSMVMWIYANSVPFTDAQKFKGKFDDCKEEVRKALEGTGTWNLQQMSYLKCALLSCADMPIFIILYTWGTSASYNKLYMRMQTHSVLCCSVQPGTFSVCYINMQNVTLHWLSKRLVSVRSATLQCRFLTR